MERAAAHYRRSLKKLTESVIAFLGQIDVLMKQPSSDERGRKIARLCNSIEMINDGIRYSTLGVDFRKDKKSKRYEEHQETLSKFASEEQPK